MRKNNRKGFTIVELVIVIAVIGILAGVMIPTISGVVTNAKTASNETAARNYYNEYIIEHEEIIGKDAWVKVDETVFYLVDDGKFVVDDEGKLLPFTSATSENHTLDQGIPTIPVEDGE